MTEKNIRIEFLQQNCRKMASVANELHILASQNEATIVCMQEPSFQVKKTQKLTGFNNLSHYHDANTQGCSYLRGPVGPGPPMFSARQR